VAVHDAGASPTAAELALIIGCVAGL